MVPIDPSNLEALRVTDVVMKRPLILLDMTN